MSLDSWQFLASKGKEGWLYSDTKDLGYSVSQGARLSCKTLL